MPKFRCDEADAASDAEAWSSIVGGFFSAANRVIPACFRALKPAALAGFSDGRPKAREAEAGAVARRCRSEPAGQSS